MNRLKSRIAIVTGGAVGIGRACAERMAEENAKVAVFDILTTEGEALAAIDAAAARFGGLQVMVNNAGLSGSPKPTDQVTEAEGDRVQAVSVKGVFFGTKHAMPHLRAAGGGSIVNLSSLLGLVGSGGLAPYHASKGAVRLMSKNDAIAYALEGIRVNSIHPGYSWTPMMESHLRATSDDPEAAKAPTGSAHPVGHLGEPDDIAWAVVYLASAEAKLVTGAELAVDGGYTAR